MLTALADEDAEYLAGLALSELEFRTVVWPELPSSRPERGLPFEYVWGDLNQKSTNALRRLVARHGGRRYTLAGGSLPGRDDAVRDVPRAPGGHPRSPRRGGERADPPPPSGPSSSATASSSCSATSSTDPRAPDGSVPSTARRGRCGMLAGARSAAISRRYGCGFGASVGQASFAAPAGRGGVEEGAGGRRRVAGLFSPWRPSGASRGRRSGCTARSLPSARRYGVSRRGSASGCSTAPPRAGA